MRFEVRDWTELSEGESDALLGAAAEQTDDMAFVVDTEAEVGDAVVAFIPREVGGIVPSDLAQRVAVLVALGEPTAAAAEPDEDATPVRLYPQTAREALLEIRRLAATVEPVTELAREAESVALEGLARTEPINFELTDQLADRLAEAHTVLRELQDGGYVGNDTFKRIPEVLSLPPDLETIVERRKR